MDICEEPWHSGYLESPCGRRAKVWHDGRPMCRICRFVALRSEARHRRATEGGIFGWLVNAAPILLFWGIILVVCFACRDKFWEYPHYEHVQLHAFWVFILVVWKSIEWADKWLVQAWQRRRKGEKEKDHAHRDDGERPVPLE